MESLPCKTCLNGTMTYTDQRSNFLVDVKCSKMDNSFSKEKELKVNFLRYGAHDQKVGNELCCEYHHDEMAWW